MFTFVRYVPTRTIGRKELRNLQKIYSERTVKKDKECVARWIYRFATHLQVDVDQWKEPYVDSSDDDEEMNNSDDQDIPHVDTTVYVNMTEPLVSFALTGDAEEDEYIQEESAFVDEE